MSKRRKRIVLVGILLTIGVCWAWFRQNEPTYRGRTLAQWFAASRLERAARPSEDEYRDALRALGTNDLPGLVRRISFDANRCFAQKLFNVLPGSVTPQPLLECLLDRKWNEDARATDAMEVFQALGSKGAPAIPQLTKIAMRGAHTPAHRAVDCLGYIGEDAIPALIMVATNTQPQAFRAFGWLVAYTNSPQATRVVAQYAHDPRFEVLLGPSPAAVITNTSAH
jgi:hypothetical protein